MGRRAWVIAIGIVAAGALIGMAGVVWWFQRGEAPAAVDLESAVTRIEAPDPADDSRNLGADSGVAEVSSPATIIEESSAAAVADGSSTTDAGTEPSSADPAAESVSALDGVWTVQVNDGTVDLRDQPSVSFAGYRVDEMLAGGIGENTAVGRTADVSGAIEVIGNTLVAATVEVTMSTLRTDDSHRDSHARESLRTGEFPTSTFTLVEPLDLPAGMASGEALSGSAVGDLTIKGVTNRATFDLQAQVVGDTIVAVGSSDVVFSAYGVTEPSSIAVISVEDNGIMEFQLIFTR